MLHDEFDLHHTTLQVDHQGGDLLDIEMPEQHDATSHPLSQ
jgi:cobalt-zinc-cadmium efflux system protein